MKISVQYDKCRIAYAKALQQHRPSSAIGKRLVRIVASILEQQAKQPELPLVRK